MEVKKITPNIYRPIQITLQSPAEEHYFRGIFGAGLSDCAKDYKAWGQELLKKIGDLAEQ